MRIVHLTASTFLGGPERQMLGLAAALPRDYTSTFLSFSEGGRCRGFLAAARSAVLGIASDLPPGVRDSWLARPDVAALFEA